MNGFERAKLKAAAKAQGKAERFRDQHAKSHRARYLRLRAAGLCTSCQKPTVWSICPACARARTARANARAQKGNAA